MKNLKVLKFGGTSLRTRFDKKKIIEVIAKERENGNDIIIVVSAVGRLGDPYSTDTLLRHIKYSEVSSREIALISSCGEIISSVILSSHLNKNGFKSIALTGGEAGIITSNNYLDSTILNIDGERIRSSINEGFIPIITGFQGNTELGNVTLLSRGGSDVTAAALSSFLHANQLDIYTDVPGIMTTDPKVLNSAKTLKHLNYHLALEIADNGGKVIHPEAIRWAEKNNIKIKIKTLKGKTETTISQYGDHSITPGKIVCVTSYDMDEKRQKVTIIGNDLNQNKELHSYISHYDMNIQSLSFFQDKIELVLPKTNATKCLKNFHDNFI
ncbi:hypothetical protein [Sediminibacillus albus]|uniref:aspartate kinase n=1 Tax=Sediminibacillus albus TaxID=407036 RepID=A0A1G8YCK6_9BACI|nr:hypothetical protein [Sediminibacillus albus]SDK00592.1 aspartate kinase [Sediminibacillus albus]